MRDSMTNTSRRIVIPLAAAFVASALGASVAVAQDEPAYAGLDKDLSRHDHQDGGHRRRQLRGHV